MQINHLTLNPQPWVNSSRFPRVPVQAGPGLRCSSEWLFSPKQKQLLSKGIWWPKIASSFLFPSLETASLSAEEQTL